MKVGKEDQLVVGKGVRECVWWMECNVMTRVRRIRQKK